MPISTTYLLLQSQIADELGGRTDLLSTLSGSGLTLSPIKNAIQSAIAKWERTPFYFTETYSASWFSTVAGTETYATAALTAIATNANIYRLNITSATTRTPLTRRAWNKIGDKATSTANVDRGLPTEWAYAAEQIRLWPIPDAIYAIGALYTQRLTALSADSDTNVWTQDGFDLIKAEAKLILALEVLHDSDLAARMRLAIYGDPQDQRAKGYLQVLLDETERRGRFDTDRSFDDVTGAKSVSSGR